MTSPRNTMVLLLAALLLAGIGWFVWPRNEPAPVDTNATPRADGRSPTTAPVTAPIATRDGNTNEPATAPPDAPTPTDAERERAPAGEQTFLRVTLRGVHPDVPWTAPVQIEFVGLVDTGGAVHNDEVVPDAEGHARFVMPTWWKRCRHGRITANNPRYEPATEQWMGSIDIENGIFVDVKVISELHGRVVDSRGNPVLAHVVAVPDLGGAGGESIASVGTNADGEWRLAVPPGQQLLLIAQPMHRVPFNLGMSWDELQRGSEVEMKVLPDPGAKLLPTSRSATCAAGETTQVEDLVLPDASMLHGLVLWNDGAPIPNALLQLEPRGGEPIRAPDSSIVHRLPNGRLARTALASTDANGAFSLPMLAGTTADVRLDSLGGTILLANGDVVQPVTGGTVEFRVPRPVTFRAVANGAPEAGAVFEVFGSAQHARSNRLRAMFEANPDWRQLVAAEMESLQIVPNGPVRVRARKGSRCSAWFEGDSAAAGKTIDLALEERLRPVTITFEGATLGQSIGLAWRASDGREGGETVWRHPPDAPARLFLEPGRYRLWLTYDGTARAVSLPAESEFAVAEDPVAVTLTIRTGCGLLVEATDGSGVHVAGTCRVRSASGEDVTDAFTMQQQFDSKRSAPGELMAGGPNRLARVLPPGEYELLFDFPKHGQRRERATLVEGEITNVVVRL